MDRRFPSFILVVAMMISLSAVSLNAIAGDPHVANGPYVTDVLYLWHRGQHEEYDYYMNGDNNDPQSDPSDSGTMGSTGTARYYAFFDQDPAYEFEDLYLDTSTNVVATIHLDFERPITKLTASLKDAAAAVDIGSAVQSGASGDQVYIFQFKPAVEKVTNHLELKITFDLETIGAVSYTFYTDGTSFVTLPLLRDTDKDGNPDEYDDDDDNDGFTDAEELVAGTDTKDINSYPVNENGNGGSSGSYGTEFTVVQLGLVLVVLIAVFGIIYFAIRRKRAGE